MFFFIILGLKIYLITFVGFCADTVWPESRQAINSNETVVESIRCLFKCAEDIFKLKSFIELYFTKKFVMLKCD